MSFLYVTNQSIPSYFTLLEQARSPLFSLPFSLCFCRPFPPFSLLLFLRWYGWDKWYNRASRGLALYHLKNISRKSGTDSATAVPLCTTCPILYHLYLRHARWHSDTEDAGGEPVDPGFADLRQANLRLVFPVAAGQQAFRFLA